MSSSGCNEAKQRLLICLSHDHDQPTQRHAWHQFSTQAGISSEWIIAAHLGQTEISEEQIHMVANLFGRC